MRVSVGFAWYDLWVGLYWSSKHRTLCICPLPMLVIALEFPRADVLLPCFWCKGTGEIPGADYWCGDTGDTACQVCKGRGRYAIKG